MYYEWPPRREDELVPWSVNFLGKIVSAPTTYSLTAAQAATYELLHDDFVAKWTIANDPDTRTPVAVSLKDVAKVTLVKQARTLGGIVQRAETTTNTMRLELGLPERDYEPTPIPAPDHAPLIEIVSARGSEVVIKLKDATGFKKRGKPLGVDGAAVYAHIGETAPVGGTGWDFQGNMTRTKFLVTFDPAITPGTKVWITACWFNPRKQAGPAAAAVSVNLPGGATVVSA